MTVGRIPNVEGGIQPTLLTTTGDIMYASSASNPARLGIGTASQILAVNSGATAPEWVAAPASGGMTLISTTTLSGVTTTLSSIPQTYNSLFLVVSGVTGNTSNARIRCLPNNVNNLSNQSIITAAAVSSLVDSVTGLTSGITLRTDADNAFILQINNYTSTTSYKPFTYYGFYVVAGPANNTITAGGAFRSNTAITSLVFDYGGTNTFASGTVLLYGVK
jgi:hypothetical protein